MSGDGTTDSYLDTRAMEFFGIGGFVISLIALALGAANAVQATRQRSRQENAAVTGDIYPVLRTLRDASCQYSKPLGGQRSEDLVTLHYAIIDLSDLASAINDKQLRDLVTSLIEHPVTSIVLMIDPPRFESLYLRDRDIALFLDLAKKAAMAIARCQQLRRGVS